MSDANFCPNCFADGFIERCPHCGYIGLSQAGNHLILPPGTTLQNRYLIGRTLGAGGFGITYLVKDKRLSRLCAVKEYLPSMLAVRDPATLNVYPSSTDNQDTFTHGLKVFKHEANILRKFTGNDTIVQVYDYFEQNSTAYFVMEYLDGVNLKALMRSMGGKLPLDLATEILQNISTILEEVHTQGLLHRDISPENIFVTKNGHTKLIDFGATRFFVGERSQSLSVILKPGFAPPEQYSSRGNQGPWTDLYALCATYYTVVSGKPVPDAPDRLAGEPIPPLTLTAPQIPPHLEAAIQRGLSLDYRVRQQDMREFRTSIHGVNANPGPSPDQSVPEIPLAVKKSAPLKGTPFVQNVRNNTSGDRWLIPKNISMNIGRSAEQCNIVIDAPNISRIHCTIKYDDKSNCFYLTDCSTNGTLVEKGRLEKGRAHALSPGDLFFITTKENAMKVGLE